jgi:two-component system chemotaxis response regulator CheY
MENKETVYGDYIASQKKSFFRQAETGQTTQEMRETILVVDDDYFIRTLLNFLLRDHYNVVTIENGFKAMLWLDKGNQPDLILTDVDMPQIDGFSLLAHLRKSGFYRSIPVFMLTGHSDPFLEEKCRNSGATGFLTKPFNPPALLNIIRLTIQGKAETSEINNIVKQA